MNRIRSAIYDGAVVHQRLRPVAHKLRYKVFTILFDCDELENLNRKLWPFSYNRFNICSLHDRDHGDGTPLRDYLQTIAGRSGYGASIDRFMMLCYPRILGYVFNPLTVYFGLDSDDQVQLVIYEVNNTFGERMTYVIPAKPDENGLIAQSCLKQLYVSPFNEVKGTYSFRVTPLDKDLTLGVALRDETGPLMKAYFRGSRSPLTVRNLMSSLWRTGWMTVKVICGIYFEALKLWLKGLRLIKRPSPPQTPISYTDLYNKRA